MRKKRHFKISPQNHFYDKYYVINYLEAGKNWQDHENETPEKKQSASSSDTKNAGTAPEDLDPVNDAEVWDDWVENSPEEDTVCLFDDRVFATVQEAIDVMQAEYDFHLPAFLDKLTSMHINSLYLDMSLAEDIEAPAESEDPLCSGAKDSLFYQRIQLINFVRSATMENTCLYCGAHFSSMDEFSNHMRDSGHASHFEKELAEERNAFKREKWQIPHYLYPVVEADPLLYAIDDEC